MKTKFILLTTALLLSLGVVAQSPEKISYQAVARDLSGNPMMNSSLTVVFQIRQGSGTGTVVYSETQNKTTNPFGLFTAAIGGGTPITGTFAGITWGSGSFYLGVLINGNPMGATQLLSVPYALYAKESLSGPSGNNSLTIVTAEPSGANCASGGNKIEVGVDDNGDGTLQAVEIDVTYYVCDGLDGASNSSDTSTTNELQTISISNDTLFLSNGGYALLPSVAGDNWGTAIVNTLGGNISGDGTVASPIEVADNDTSSTNELELPMTGNTVGDVLMWDGSGWISGTGNSANDSDWTINGNNMSSQNSGNVGIGTSTPSTKLDVYTNAVERGGQFVSNFPSSNNKYGIYALAQGAGIGINYGAAGEATGATTNIGVRGRAFGGTNNWAGYFEEGDVYIQNRLAIGTASPTATLHVNDPANSQGSIRISAGTATGVSTTDGFAMYINSAGAGLLNRENTPLYLGTNGANRMTISAAGNVGIGITSPSATLDIVGTMQLADGNEGAGKILTSDAAGNATWAYNSIYYESPNLNSGNTNATTTWQTLGPTFTINKSYDDSKIEVTFNSIIRSGSFSGVSGILFEIRIDGNTASFDNQGVLKTGDIEELISMFAVFEGLLKGAHTIQIYVRTATGTSTGTMLDPGGWGGRMISKETF